MSAPQDARRSLRWAHGEVVLQRAGAMLGPLLFFDADAPPFDPLHRPHWADAESGPELDAQLRHLRGEWPCVPFGRVDRPSLPAGWVSRGPGDPWAHGYGAHHAWTWLEEPAPLTLRLGIVYPDDSPIVRLERRIQAHPDKASLDLNLLIEVRSDCALPVALHPTLSLERGPVRLSLPGSARVLSYPVPVEAGISQLCALQTAQRPEKLRLSDGGEADGTRFPWPFDTEELFQIIGLNGFIKVRFDDLGWSLALSWPADLLPDAMIWLSQSGRLAAPWSGRNRCLGVEPVNGVFDLGRIAVPPRDHPLSERAGLRLQAGQTLEIPYRMEASR